MDAGPELGLVASMVAHTGGFGWDEGVVLAIPVFILVALQISARRRAAQESPDDDDA